jgi:hypothetical protein
MYRDDPMGPLYVVTEKFDATRSDWAAYVESSGLEHVREIVSLDSILCERVVDGPIASDWPHIVNEDFMLDYFTDLPHLLERAGSVKGRNVLCVFRNPTAPPAAPSGFAFIGYDLVDVLGGISALVNCGGYPDAFANEELSGYGLIDSFERAYEVRRALREKYPNGEHSNCHVFAVFRRDEL